MWCWSAGQADERVGFHCILGGEADGWLAGIKKKKKMPAAPSVDAFNKNTRVIGII